MTTGEAPGAATYLPARKSLASMREAVQACRGCPLYRNATQAVFGEGPARARVVLIGEQPGDREDIEGRPFVGPAGRILDRALGQAGIDRKAVYVTNAVKHFSFEPRGKARLHKRPRPGEVRACRPWLDSELELVHPAAVVLLGATAAQSLFGAGFRVTKERGKPLKSNLAPLVIATIHPSSILREPDSAARDLAFEGFVADLKLVASHLESL